MQEIVPSAFAGALLADVFAAFRGDDIGVNIEILDIGAAHDATVGGDPGQRLADPFNGDGGLPGGAGFPRENVHVSSFGWGWR